MGSDLNVHVTGLFGFTSTEPTKKITNHVLVVLLQKRFIMRKYSDWVDVFGYWLFRAVVYDV